MTNQQNRRNELRQELADIEKRKQEIEEILAKPYIVNPCCSRIFLVPKSDRFSYYDIYLYDYGHIPLTTNSYEPCFYCARCGTKILSWIMIDNEITLTLAVDD